LESDKNILKNVGNEEKKDSLLPKILIDLFEILNDCQNKEDYYTQ
jgi:hypothetical protein